YRGPLLINETSLAWLSGSDDATSTVLAVSRHDAGAGLVQFISTDGGATWASQGLIPDGTRADVSPWLYRLSGDKILLAYHERYGMTYPIRVGQSGDVAANASNWSPKQAISIYRPVTTVFGQSGYPSVLSATGDDDDLIEVAYDAVPGGNGNLLVQPISLP